MMEALPNLHAAVIHFPIVLIPLAVVAEFIGLAVAKSETLPCVALGTWGLAAVSSIGTYLAGRSAADALNNVPAVAQLALAEHADAAWLLVGGVSVLFALRSAAILGGARANLAVRIGVVLLGSALLFQLVETADRGGALVYGHALAVSVPAPEPCPECDPRPATSGAATRWIVDEDGSAIWLPGPGDLSDPGGVAEIIGTLAEAGGGEGLRVRSDGRVLLLLPRTWSDVQITATLTTEDFQGTVGVVHHVSSDAGTMGGFTLRTDGAAILFSQEPGTETTLDQGQWDPVAQPTISVSAAGSHLKGLVGGKTVTHGHASAMPKGRVGLLIHGVGEVGVRRVEIVPLVSH